MKQGGLAGCMLIINVSMLNVTGKEAFHPSPLPVLPSRSWCTPWAGHRMCGLYVDCLLDACLQRFGERKVRGSPSRHHRIASSPRINPRAVPNYTHSSPHASPHTISPHAFLFKYTTQ